MAEGSVQDTNEKTAEKKPEQTQDVNTAQDRFLTLAKFNYIVVKEEEALHKEIQEKRLENLRKELVGLKNTDWQYDPISKHIGQS